MKVAIVHPWFLEAGGAEKVADILASMYPDADIFTLSFDPAMLGPHLRGRKVYASSLNLLLRRFRFLLTPFMILTPFAVESFDLTGYDLIISSCPPVMGVNASQDAVHVCYCHTPQRIWWDSYARRQVTLPWGIRQVFVFSALFVRMWEFGSMQRVDHVVSNSNYIAKRVQKYFRRESTVIYPPVDTSSGYLASSNDNYYFTLSRLESLKRVDLLIEACNRLQRRLLIGGTGRREKSLRAIAGPAIEFLGHIPQSKLPEYFANCRAFLFAADEDFGIAPVEAQSFGRPVIAYGHGGSLETVRVGDAAGLSDTGVFFAEQTVESVMRGIQQFESCEDRFDPIEIQSHARQFDTSAFLMQMGNLVHAALEKR